MATSSSSEEKTPEVECGSAGAVPVSKLTANYPIIPRAELDVLEQLGAGTYGSVFRGLWNIQSASKPMIVALKKVFMLEREVDILSQVRHRNIIQFFGVSRANPDFYIVTEYAENGSLFEYLHNANAELSFERTLKMAKQIAQGVAYLHYEAPTTIIHRDLKSKNVVIGKKMVCKLCDFGTSKDLTHSHTAPTWGGTAAWMSPEIINQCEGITTATDVWSYGVLLWEIFSREIPYKGLTDFKIYSITSQEGCQLVVPDSCPRHLSDLLEKCWYKTPKERIEMREIVCRLDAINGNEQVHNECAHFVKQKEEWHRKIEEQLVNINKIELDYERKKEELKRWEQILRRRESSHRNFLHVIDLMNTTDVAEWDADCVCEWVQYMAAGKDISEQVLDKIIGRVLQHEIRGSRLLQVTERDLENLGIEPEGVRHYVVEKIGELNYLRPTKDISNGSIHKSISSVSPQDDYLNFPPLQMSAEIEARKKNSQNKSPLEHPISLMVGMYSRMIMNGNSRRCRFKIFLDSDWDSLQALDDIPSEINDSATVIKDVFISITNTADNSLLLESVRCVCPPFGYLEWTELNLVDAPSINISLSVTYTDQIVQPRNTRINVEIDDFSQNSRIINSKVVLLKIRPMPTNTSLSRMNSSMFHSQSLVDKPSMASPLQGVWRARRGSVDNAAIMERSPPAIVNEIIPISLMNTDIAEFHRRYQQRFAKRGGAISQGNNIGKFKPKSPLASGPHSKSRNLETGRSNSTSAYSTSAASKLGASRRGPSLTVVVQNKNNQLHLPPLRKASNNALNGNKLKDTQNQQHHQPQPNGLRVHEMRAPANFRLRTKSETEATTKSQDKKESPNEERPTFYVCDEDTPSTSRSNELDEKSMLSYPNKKEKCKNIISSNHQHSASNNAIDSKTSKNRNLANGQCENTCECRRSRRNALPAAVNDNELGEQEASGELNTDELKERKYKPKLNGNRRCKKFASKAEIKVDDEPRELLEKQIEANQPGAKFGDKQNTISQHVYGGYNKWRWKT